MSANVLNNLIALVFIMYAARILGPHQFGIYGLINAWILLFSFLQNLGVNSAAIREIAQNKERVTELFNVVITLRLVLALVAYALLVIVASLMSYPQDVRFLLYLAGAALPMIALSDSYGVLYVALERMTTPALVSVVVSIMSTGASIAMLRAGFGLQGVIAVGVLGTAIGTIFASVWVRARIVRFRIVLNGREMLKLVKAALPFGVLVFIHQLQRQITVILLSKLPNPHAATPQLGFYNAAASISNRLMVIPQSLRLAVLPSLAANIANHEVVHRAVAVHTKLLLVLISAPLIILIMVYSEGVMTLVFGAEYAPAAPVFSILGVATSLYILAGPMETAISATRHIIRFVPWAVVITAVTLVMAVILIPVAGAVGAALGVLLGTLVGVYIRYRFYFAIFHVSQPSAGALLRIAGPLLALAAALVAVGKFVMSDLVMVALACTSYALVVLGTGVLSPAEKAALGRWLRQVTRGLVRRVFP